MVRCGERVPAASTTYTTRVGERGRGKVMSVCVRVCVCVCVCVCVGGYFFSYILTLLV